MNYPEVETIRQASRQIVRELGFLDQHNKAMDLSHSESHALIELGQAKTLTSVELSDVLQLDKASVSRVVTSLMEADFVSVEADEGDRRRKPLVLTAKGKRKLEAVHAYSAKRVNDALGLLSVAERSVIEEGLRCYAAALSRCRRQEEFTLRLIQAQDDVAMARIIRGVLTEFSATGPGFAIHDPEVDAMSASYATPQARYFVLERSGQVVGGGGYASLLGGADDVCEVRKMYILPEARQAGMGRKLFRHVLNAAREAGFRMAYLETLETMRQARRLYESEGFRALNGPMGATGHFSCDRWYARSLVDERITIAPYQNRFKEQVVSLVLGIQQGEFGVPVTLADQPDLQDVPAYYHRGKGNFWVALEGERVVGTIAMLDFGHGRAALRKMFVAADRRGKERGVAQALFAGLHAWCVDKGIQEIYLGTVDVLVAAHKFYEKNGFVAIEKAQLPKEFPLMPVDTRFYYLRLGGAV